MGSLVPRNSREVTRGGERERERMCACMERENVEKGRETKMPGL